MPRLTISLSQPMHKYLSAMAVEQNSASLSQVINQLLQLGIRTLNDDEPIVATPVEQHCQQLIMQMNALIKNLSVEILKFNQNDFEQLRQAALAKYNEMTSTMHKQVVK